MTLVTFSRSWVQSQGHVTFHFLVRRQRPSTSNYKTFVVGLDFCVTFLLVVYKDVLLFLVQHSGTHSHCLFVINH